MVRLGSRDFTDNIVWILSLTVKGSTALHCAAAGGYAECFYCLLHHEASLGIRTLRGENALDMARKNGNSKAIGKACTYYV